MQGNIYNTNRIAFIYIKKDADKRMGEERIKAQYN